MNVTFLDNFRNSSFFYAITDRVKENYGSDYFFEPKGKNALYVTHEGKRVGVITMVNPTNSGAKVMRYTNLEDKSEWTPNLETHFAGANQYD